MHELERNFQRIKLYKKSKITPTVPYHHDYKCGALYTQKQDFIRRGFINTLELLNSVL